MMGLPRCPYVSTLAITKVWPGSKSMLLMKSSSASQMAIQVNAFDALPEPVAQVSGECVSEVAVADIAPDKVYHMCMATEGITIAQASSKRIVEQDSHIMQPLLTTTTDQFNAMRKRDKTSEIAGLTQKHQHTSPPKSML
jgi:hypothetical protein